jgi:quercetin dioxygenase-like cupin family protein
MEIRRFGIGHRRHEGPPGTFGVDGQSIHADRRGAIAELAFRPNAAMAPHSNPNLTYFVVIEGGGFVQVGEERARVAAGEAVVWPADIVHAAWTEQTPMRALVVEFGVAAVDPPTLASGVIEPRSDSFEAAETAAGRPSGSVASAGRPSAVGPAHSEGIAPAPETRPDDHESPDREPW